MNLADTSGRHDLSADIARLLDEGFQVVFTALAALFPGYVVTLTGPLGSTWRGAGATPAEALRSVWPLGDDTADGDPDNDDGQGDDDVLDAPEPACAVCGSPVGIFDSTAGQWEHFRIVAHRVETFDAGHVVILADRPAGEKPLPALLRAPRDSYQPAEPYAPCVTCGRTREAHRLAAAARGQRWDDDNDGGGPCEARSPRRPVLVGTAGRAGLPAAAQAAEGRRESRTG
jgi:hypothetical protein